VDSEPEQRRHGTAAIGGGLSRGLVLLLAAACGAAVANVYYAQPLLHTLGRTFGVSNGTAGLLVTATQIGYVSGLMFLVPLGDLRERRALISGTLALTAVALVVVAVSPDIIVFAAAIAIVGLTSVMAMVIVPMASSLATEDARGRVVGTVMSGLLIGILLARTISGAIAQLVGWRAVYWFAAVAILAVAATLRRVLPRVPSTTSVSYRGLLRSVLTLIAHEPVLRQRMAIGAMTFGAFNTLWNSLSFLLAGSPYHYGNLVIGLFGLVGVVGAFAATTAGRLADRGLLGHTTTAAIVILLVSWAILAAGKTSVVALIIGIALLDLGAQALHIANQHAIYALAPEARSRLTTAYMVAYFFGGASCSALSGTLYDSDGWSGVCVLGGAVGLAALLIWGLSEAARTRGGRIIAEEG
jgi:predicted MFS family arabinose efflux permease